MDAEIPRPVRWPSEQDWVTQRPLIERLYRDEKRTLREVINFLVQKHSFKATIKMYKNKITKWGLDKKQKKGEIEVMMRKSLQRAGVGKSSAFKIRGSKVEARDVLRYAFRRRLAIELDDSMSGPPTPCGLECFTPVERPNSPISTPTIFHIPESIFTSIRNYFTGSFDAGTWVKRSNEDCTSTKRGGNEMSALKNMYSNHDVACKLLDKGSFEDAGRVLINAASGFRDIVLAEHPRTLGAIFDLLVFLRGQYRSEIATLALRQFRALARVLLIKTHPLRNVLEHMAAVYGPNSDPIVLMAWKCVLDQFENATGPFSYSTLRSRLEYIQMRGVLHGQEGAEVALKVLQRECESTCGEYDVRSFKLLETLGENLMSQKKFSDAEDVALRIVIGAPRVQPYTKSNDLLCGGLFILANARYQRGDQDGAEAALREAIQNNVSAWGWGHALTLKYLTVLEEWLRSWGDRDSLDKIRLIKLHVLKISDTSI